MSSLSDEISIGYFGKLSSRDDFVKAADDPLLINVIDEWLTNAMEKLSADARWKIIYDEIAPIYFLVAATKMNKAVAGYLVASRDQSDRRFPFVSFGQLTMQNPQTFLLCSPTVLANFWSRLDSQTHVVFNSIDSSNALQQLRSQDILVDLSADSFQVPLADFLSNKTVGDLDKLTIQHEFGGSARQIILALGLLLHPVMASGVSRLDKNLILPLPDTAQNYIFVATLWMQIISPFLFNADFELVLLLTKINQTQVLVIGFDGASTNTLFSVMSPKEKNDHNIRFDDTAWVESAIKEDYRLQQLSSYLDQPNLKLSSALLHFKETFLG